MKIAYTIKETAEALGCGMNTTYNLVNSGQLKSFKFGKKIMIPAQSIQKIINEDKQNVDTSTTRKRN
ncbi:MAG: helix-turn-helix domain-containing protein [Candidatus Neomarinimicrobiota bacterium]